MKLPGKEQWLYAANLLADKLFSRGLQTKPEDILLVKLDEIGDMATCTHVFELLRKRYPQARITLLCKPFVRSLVQCDPNLNSIITDIALWNRRYDCVLELRGTWASLFRCLRYRPSLRLSRAAVRFRNRGAQLHETLTNFEVVKPLLHPGSKNLPPKLYFDESDAQQVEAFLSERHIGQFALIHAGARRKLRQWNPERFAVLIRHLHGKHGLEIVFTGSEDENNTVEQIRSMAQVPTHTSLGHFSLAQLSCLASKAAFYAGNESGPLHIAAVFSVPTLAFYGPGVPRVFYPLNPNARVLHHVLSCNPCDQVHCVQPENPCISMISTADATLAADEILGA